MRTVFNLIKLESTDSGITLFIDDENDSNTELSIEIIFSQLITFMN